MAKHAGPVKIGHNVKKLLAVAIATLTAITPGLYADGVFTWNDGVTLLCATVAAVSALYMKSPMVKSPPNG